MNLISLLFAGGVFVGMILLLEVGRRLGRRRQGRDEEGARAGLGAVEGAVFALLGLLIAFTFSGAAARFDTRRQMIVEEANAIGTAWLRLDLLPPAAQPELRDLVRRYLDARLAIYEKIPDPRPGVSASGAHSHRRRRPRADRTSAGHEVSICVWPHCGSGSGSGSLSFQAPTR